MGTNFYARRIPTKERKSELCELINSEHFYNIMEEISNTFGGFRINYDNKKVGGVFHLGKRSAGWKFLWNPNIYIIRHGHSVKEEVEPNHFKYTWIEEPSTPYYLYPLSKEGIWNFINKPNIVIYDEYEEKQDKEKFFEEAVNWTTWKGEEAWDSKTYTEFEREKNPYWKTYTCSGEYIDMLEKIGFKFISEDKSDFYSDGLRFATNTDFS